MRGRRSGRRAGSRRAPLLRSIRTRLAVTFFLVTLLSVAVIYAIVAPPLRSSLETQRIHNLERVVNSLKTPIDGAYYQLNKIAFDTSRTSDLKAAHAIVATLASQTLTQVNVIDVGAPPKGNEEPSIAFLAAAPIATDNGTIDQFAATGVPTGKTYTSKIIGGYALYGRDIKAPQVNYSRIVVFSYSLSDVAGDVSLVRSRIELAAAIGLLVALLIGALVARALTRRVLLLESTAQRVAQGDFEAQFSVARPGRWPLVSRLLGGVPLVSRLMHAGRGSPGDELGQLAAALANMQSQLEGLDAARRRFIATASHELRTPIFSLGGFLELIEDESLDEETRDQFLHQVRAQVDRLGKLATQLLDLTRLESGSIELATTITDVGVLARAVGAEFAPALAQHDSSLDLRLPAEPLRVVCDPERVAQLLRILIDNAIAHTPEGTAVVVTATPPNNGDGAQLSVRDHGPGIPQDAVARVFEPFYSADGARGAGLGLAIARELALHMRARLEIASEPGDTTFTLTLAGADSWPPSVAG